jgi:hypothetical protein
MPTAKGWSRAFDDPIPLPDGRMLMTLGDAGRYIAGLPSKVLDRSEWQAAAAIPTPLKRLKKLPTD